MCALRHFISSTSLIRVTCAKRRRKEVLVLRRSKWGLVAGRGGEGRGAAAEALYQKSLFPATTTKEKKSTRAFLQNERGFVRQREGVCGSFGGRHRRLRGCRGVLPSRHHQNQNSGTIHHHQHHRTDDEDNDVCACALRCRKAKKKRSFR